MAMKMTTAKSIAEGGAHWGAHLLRTTSRKLWTRAYATWCIQP